MNNIKLIYQVIETEEKLIGKKANRYVEKELKKAGAEILFRNNGNSQIGTPDYKILFNNEEYFVEVKTDNDSIRLSQIEWINKNPNNKTFYIWLKQRTSTNFIPNIQNNQIGESKNE